MFVSTLEFFRFFGTFSLGVEPLYCINNVDGIKIAFVLLSRVNNKKETKPVTYFFSNENFWFQKSFTEEIYLRC